LKFERWHLLFCIWSFLVSHILITFLISLTLTAVAVMFHITHIFKVRYTSTLMMMTEMDIETSVYNVHLTRLIAREDFIKCVIPYQWARTGPIRCTIIVSFKDARAPAHAHADIYSHRFYPFSYVCRWSEVNSINHSYVY
jgi:hypothetical protein